jgi:hypothetical protein
VLHHEGVSYELTIFHIGLDSIGQSLKNANYQNRADPQRKILPFFILFLLSVFKILKFKMFHSLIQIRRDFYDEFIIKKSGVP